MRRAWTELWRLSGPRFRMQQPVFNSWSLADGPSFVTGMDSQRDTWTDRSNGAEVQVSAGYPVLGGWRGISSAAVGGQLSTELRGGLGPPMLFAGRNPFLEGSVRFKSQKKKNKKKKNVKKASKEDRQRLRMLQRERKQRKLRMTPEEALVYRMHKAQRKIALQEKAVKKYALPERPEKPDDPEVMTPEQLHALKKLGYKNKNYVPVGRRGIYGGVIQNMHLHWKKHETVRVDCDNYKRDEVRQMAAELEKISGGKVIDIHQGTTIIMYRGKNYKQPKKLIPDNMLDKRKALLKSLAEQSLKSLREYVAKLEVELKKLRAQMAAEAASSPPQPPEDPLNELQRMANIKAAHAKLDADVLDDDDETLDDTDDDFDLSDLSSESGSEDDEDLGHDRRTMPEVDDREVKENRDSDACVWETDNSGSDSEDEGQYISVQSATSTFPTEEEVSTPAHTILEALEDYDHNNREKEANSKEAKLDDSAEKEDSESENSRSLLPEQKATQVSVG